MSEWKCGNCGKIYNINELLSLKKIKMVETDEDINPIHGFTSVCKCGYRFHIDRWRIDDRIKVIIDEKESELIISSIFLELNAKILDEEDEYYETAIMWLDNTEEGIKNIEVMQQYDTKENAILGHNKLVSTIKDGKYKVEKEIVFENEENRIIFEDE
jgi:hypothetical protein